MKLPRTLFGDRVRTSTLALMMAFMLVLTGWILVRPEPVEYTEEVVTVRTKRNPARATPTPVPTPVATPRPAATPRPTPRPTPTPRPGAVTPEPAPGDGEAEDPGPSPSPTPEPAPPFGLF